jgi:mono/diheme cytochrome c family protein
MGACFLAVKRKTWGEFMGQTKLLAAALLVLSASTAANAQRAEAPASEGEYLARAGDCIACHSVRGGKAFAGGLRMGTPMGVIYSTNITPDPETGIGNYSYEDFDRAVRSGIAKDGHHLYPAMPYPSYAKISDEDMQALYAFFMREVPPVRQENKPNEIPWYRSPRWPLAVWNTIFARSGVYAARADRDAAWNRGAYLVEGLGHCGACHTPRGWAFQEKALDDGGGAYLQGAELDAWSAPSLRGDLRTGLGGWSQDDIVTFLKSGHNDKSVAFGSMLDVVNNSTPYLSDEDIRAMAAFIKSLPPTEQQAAFVYDDAATKALEAGKPQQPGAAIYLGSCAACHGMDGKGQAPFIPPLAGNPAVLDANPSSLINLVLNGADPLVVKGVPDAYRMPQFRIQLNDDSIGEVLSFVRGAWGNGATAVTTEQVAKLRPVTDPSSDRVIVLKMR